MAIKAKPRIGGAYVNERYSLGLDIDLAKELAPLQANLPARLSLGGEYRWRSIALRGGYRYDISGNNDGSFSLGAGVILGRWVGDLALTQGRRQPGCRPGMAVRFKTHRRLPAPLRRLRDACSD